MAVERKTKDSARPGLGGMVAVGIGLGLVGLGVFLTLSFMTADVYLDPAEAAKNCWTGLLGAYVSFGAIHSIGKIPALAMAVLVIFWGIHSIKNMHFLATWPQVVGGCIVICALSMALCAFADLYDMNTGGLFAMYLSPPAILYFGRWGLALASLIVMFLGVLLAFGETAVLTIRTTASTVRDFIFGSFGMIGRVGELLKMLFSPRLAVAGAQTGEQTSRGRTSKKTTTEKRKPFTDVKLLPAKTGLDEPLAGTAEADAEANLADSDVADQDAEDTDSQAKSRYKDNLKVWHPREAFASRFLDLDLSTSPLTDTAIPAGQPEIVEAAILPAEEVKEELKTAAPQEPAADVIMDVDAEVEDSDQFTIAEAAAPGTIVDITSGFEEDEGEDDSAQEPVSNAAPIAEPEPARQEQPRAAPPPPPQAQAQPRPRPVERPAPKPEPKPVDNSLENYSLPPLELMDPPEPPQAEDRGHLERQAKILEQTLAEFKIEGRVVHIERGPRVTMYELSLAPGIRLSKVTSLSDNIAMQLKAESVRIIAPIPGKDTIGIEIPNTVKELVSLGEIVSAVNREKRRQALPVCLGKDVSGSCLVADLAKMPHLLIAGATGSGKSVCINSIIMSILMCCKPDETQLIMIDPKVVELSRFKDIPHLMSPVITDMKRAVSVLEWTCQKMDERYEQMSQVSVNNIAKFNALGEAEIRERLDAFSSLEEIEAFPKSMPYMVVIIDELADLMMVAGKEVEQHITRLAAKSRAVGIHLILATQRPSVDVITGLIKANMPCRIAFQVASKIDSRTILDQNGAESLLGQGDMLYLPPGVGKLTRAQGVFVSDEELFKVVDFTKAEAAPQYHVDLLGPVIGSQNGDVDISSFDDLFLDSGEAIIENQRGSVSLLQRKFGIGYGRASRIIDQLASVGLLGPFRDGKAREILLTMEEFDTKFRRGDAESGWDDDDEGTLAGLREDELEPAGDPWE